MWPVFQETSQSNPEFDAFDGDADGMISFEELKAHLIDLGEDLTDEEIKGRERFISNM